MKTDQELLINPDFEDTASSQKRRWFSLTPLARVLGIVMIILLVVLVVLLLSRFRPVVGGAPDMYIVNLDEFQPALESAQDPVIVDIRDQAAYREAHLPGAVHGENNNCFVYGVDICTKRACEEKQPYFFYSVKGEEYHEVRQAIERTARRGCWTEVWMLDGGFNAWEAAGLEIES